MSNRPDLYTPLLHAIAAALDIPVTALRSDPPGDDGGDVIALLRAWAAIDDAQGHRRVLNAAFREADRSGDASRSVNANVILISSERDLSQLERYRLTSAL